MLSEKVWPVWKFQFLPSLQDTNDCYKDENTEEKSVYVLVLRIQFCGAKKPKNLQRPKVHKKVEIIF